MKVAIVSGGMDSTVLAYSYAEQGPVLLVSFDYGQRHAKELTYAARTAAMLKAEHLVIDLRSVGEHLTGSALTDASVDVPLGHYADETMRSTVVPNRNAIMLNIAAGIAIARGSEVVGTAVHAGDHAIYPDCRPDFIIAQTLALKFGNEGFANSDFRVDAPFVLQDKAWIAELGDRLGVPWEHTWSCYQGGEQHCGECGTCVERREAFQLANVPDPTAYAA